MKIKTGIVVAFATALLLTPLAGFAQGRGAGGGGGYKPQALAQVERGPRDLDRTRGKAVDPAYQQDQDRDQDRTHAPDFGYTKNRDIYRGAMMSVEERNTYREQLRLIDKDSEKRTRFLADHKEKMQLRAKAQGVDLDGEIEEAE